jgi:hypothetical protein
MGDELRHSTIWTPCGRRLGGWARQQFWILYKIDKSLAPTDNIPPIPRSSRPSPSHYTEWTTMPRVFLQYQSLGEGNIFLIQRLRYRSSHDVPWQRRSFRVSSDARLEPSITFLFPLFKLSAVRIGGDWGGGGLRETTVFHITAALCTSATDRSDDMSPNKSLSIPAVSYRASSIPITYYDRHR